MNLDAMIAAAHARAELAVTVRADDGRRAEFLLPAPVESAIGDVVTAVAECAASIWEVGIDELGVMFESATDC